MSRIVVRVAAAVGLASLSGCVQREPDEAPSRIVERVQRAGAGDIRHATPEAVQQWFAKRNDLAQEVSKMCAARTDPGIPPNSEAKVCDSANAARYWTYVPAAKSKGPGFNCCN